MQTAVKIVGAFLFLALGAAGAAAQEQYPSRTVKMIVPVPAGGITDIIARAIGKALADRWGQPVVIENRPGGDQTIGTEAVAKSAPDGYTLLVVDSGVLTATPHLHSQMRYDSTNDLAPIMALGQVTPVMAVPAALPVKSVADLIALAKAQPGRLNYGSSGTGTGTHLSAELFKYMTGITMVHIPFKGGGQAVTALIGGQVQLNFATIPSVLPHVRAGRLRAVAVTTAQRSPAVPEVPTIAESGVPGYDHGPWNGMLAPAITPAAIIARLNAEAAKAMHTAELKTVLNADGAEPVGNSPQAFGAILRDETAKWAKVIKAAGIKAD